MNKSSADIEREVEDARGRIDQTVEALKDKMQPKELFDEATRMMGGASNKVLTTAVEQLRENPIPIALIGLGVAWLALSQTRRGATYQATTGDGYFPTYEGYDEDEGVRAKVKARAQAAKAKLSRTAESAKQRLAAAGHVAGEGVTDAKGRAQDLYGQAQARAGEYTRVARQKFDDTLETEPLVIGALGLAVGAAIGASLPATPVERRYIGPARSKAAEAAKAQLDQVKTVAGRAYGQVKEELHRQTGPEGEGTSLTQKASALADAGARVVRDEISPGPTH
jgi:ElaB/YqjD/DUF883 family membrane-anchored ribosome-binding protein